MVAIGAALAQMHLDIVGLQELYSEDDRRLVMAGAASDGLVHTRYFPSGAIGSGLLMLSRFPIQEASFLRFRLNGRPQELLRSDYYAGKGVARLRLETPLGPLDAYDTHLVAGYGEIGSDIYYYHRLAQAYELARYIATQSQEVPVIVTGDLNTTPDRLPYRACTALGQLTDSFWMAHPEDAGITVTTDIPYVLVHAPERIDYVLYREGPGDTLRVLSSEVTLKTAPPGAGILAYSDHYGVCTTFEWVTGAPGAPSPAIDASVLAAVSQALEEGVQRAHGDQESSWIRTGVAGLLSVILLAARSKTPISRRAFLRGLAAVISAGLLLAGGVTLSLGFQFSKEEQILRQLLDELGQTYTL
jgi:sphingomyelin phosphodiesterase 2